MVQISSRIGDCRVFFRAYTAEELETILRIRLRRFVRLFSDGSLKYIAHKVASTTADLRRAVQMVRKALFAAEADAKEALAAEDTALLGSSRPPLSLLGLKLRSQPRTVV